MVSVRGRARKPLILRIAEPRSLRQAWQRVRAGSSPESMGPDEVSMEQFGRQAAEHLKQLRSDLHDGTYAFGGYRGVALVKDRAKPANNPRNRRQISIASIRDRIVQRAILDVIWVLIRDKVCTKASFGGIGQYSRHRRRRGNGSAPDYEPKRNVQTAAAEIVRLRQSGLGWVFETDIEKFYPSIDRNRLLASLYSILPDETLNDLILAFLSTSITNAEKLPDYLAELWDPFIGVPQGGVLSPVLANLYLNEFDKGVEKAGFHMVRYVDDLVILAQSETDAQRSYELCNSMLEAVGLKIHPLKGAKTKTNILPPGKPFTFLGLDFNQATIRPNQEKWDRLRERLRLATGARLVRTLPKVINGTNGLVRGWVKAYSFCNISKKELRMIDDEVTHSVQGWMREYGLLFKRQTLDRRGRDALGLERAEKIRILPLL